MESQEKSTLVKDLAGLLVNGLEALQEGLGVTTDLWHRIRTDPEFQQQLGKMLKKLDILMAGRKHKLLFQKGDCRETLLDAIASLNRFQSIALTWEIVSALSSDTVNPDPLLSPFTQDHPVILYTTFIGYGMSYANIQCELKRRNLVSANPEEALLFFLNRYHSIPSNQIILVPGAKVNCRNMEEMLYFGRTIGGTANMSLRETKVKIPGGSFILTKRAA